MRQAALLVAALLLGCSGETGGAGGGDAFPAEPLATVTSEGGELSIEIRTAPDQPPSRGEIAVEYTVRDKDGAPRDDLDLAVLPWMPDMGHGASTKPSIEARGGGVYVVKNVRLFMPGRWELRTTISGPKSDHATVGFQIP